MFEAIKNFLSSEIWWLHIFADAVVALIYFAIFYGLYYILRKRENDARLIQSNRELAQSNALQSAVLSSTHYLVVATDKNGLITVFNKAAEIASGYNAAEVVGKKTPLVLHDRIELTKRIDGTASNFAAFIRAAVASDEEWIFVCENGTRLPVNLAVTPLNSAHNELTGYLCIYEDITKRKEMDRMKSEFISIVSHELRTPLTSIRGSLGLIAGAMSKDLPEQVKNLVDIAYKNSERLILLINDMLDIDKIVAGEMRFDIKPESLGLLVEQAVESNRAYAAKFRVTLDIAAIDPEIEIAVDGDRFIQALSNLISNAAKFSPPDSSVRIFADAHGGAVRIHVEDIGGGIPETFRPHIFEKFSQADSSDTRSKEGSGLGLHITKTIVERMGGKIGFDTVIKQGTDFWLDFPIKGQAAKDHAA